MMPDMSRYSRSRKRTHIHTQAREVALTHHGERALLAGEHGGASGQAKAEAVEDFC